MSENVYYWQKLMGDKPLTLDLEKLKNAVTDVFKNESDNYKQKLVYNLLERVRNNDQNEFFYILLKAINKPKENFKELWKELKEKYDVMPEEAFINFAYSVIIGIMATYSGGGKNE
jgi:restriction endonuclease